MEMLVTGAGGQLGYDVCRALYDRGIGYRGAASADLDVTDGETVLDWVKSRRPDAVVHCAAYTAVDRAEDEAERCWAVNVDGTRHVALACRRFDSKMIYISTDYVFSGSGTHFYRTEDQTGPLSVYGRSKLVGELAVQSLLNRFLCLSC